MDAARDVIIISPGVGKTRPCHVKSPHVASQSGHGGGLRTVNHVSSPNQGGGGETNLRDGSAVVDGRSEKTHEVGRMEFAPLGTELIPRSHGNSNSSVMEAIFFRTLIRHIH